MLPIATANRLGGEDPSINASPNRLAYGAGDVTENPPQVAPAMSPDDLQSWLRKEIEDAEQVVATIQTDRIKAGKYYDGEKFGNEEAGRSQVISRDVHDTVHAILPSMLRIFFANEHVCEFMPRGPEDVELAEQMTDYVDFVLKSDNPGFLILHAVFKDALIKSAGITKAFWSETREVISDEYAGLTVEATMLLVQDAEKAGGKVTWRDSEKTDPVSGRNLLDVTVRRLKHLGKIVVEAVPPEEFLINQTARCISSARYVGHRQYKTVSDLVAMGYDYEQVLAQAGADDQEFSLDMQEARDRLPNSNPFGMDSPADDANRPVLYVESYARVDADGDGIAEMRLICTIGHNYEIVRNSPVDERPFANWCPDPVPHSFFGNSTADQTMDIQLVKSSILRKMLDSLAAAITPRTGVVEGQCNIEDAMNNQTGAIIRMNAPGMVQPFVIPYIGQEAHPMLEYWDRVKEARTGISKASAGLDADALQSSTRAAVSATVNAAHQHIETIARVFAETGLKQLMRQLLKLCVRHQDKARMVKLRNSWVEVSPASWSPDYDVQVNVAVGAATEEERMKALQSIAAKQEQILQQFGPANPLVTVQQYRYTLAKMIEMAGFRDPSKFLQAIPANWQPPAPKEPPESPEEKTARMLAEVQVKSIQADIGKKAAELELKRQDMLLSDDRERDKTEAEIFLKAQELELKYQTEIDKARIDALIERERMQMPPVAGASASAAPAGPTDSAAPPPPPPPAPPQMAPQTGGELPEPGGMPADIPMAPATTPLPEQPQPEPQQDPFPLPPEDDMNA